MEEPGQEASEQLIEHLTRQISRRQLNLPAILFLEVARPFTFIASQGLLVCQPLLSFFFQGPRITDYAGLLADRANIDRLIARLERERPARGDDSKEKDGWKRSG